VTCPDCGTAELELRAGNGIDPDTGYCDSDYAACPACGESFDFDDLDREVGTVIKEVKAA
jgi:hypothetical protein